MVTYRSLYFCRDCKWLGTNLAVAFGNYALCPACQKYDITWTGKEQGVLWPDTIK